MPSPGTCGFDQGNLKRADGIESLTFFIKPVLQGYLSPEEERRQL